MRQKLSEEELLRHRQEHDHKYYMEHKAKIIERRRRQYWRNQGIDPDDLPERTATNRGYNGNPGKLTRRRLQFDLEFEMEGMGTKEKSEFVRNSFRENEYYTSSAGSIKELLKEYVWIVLK